MTFNSHFFWSSREFLFSLFSFLLCGHVHYDCELQEILWFIIKRITIVEVYMKFSHPKLVDKAEWKGKERKGKKRIPFHLAAFEHIFSGFWYGGMVLHWFVGVVILLGTFGHIRNRQQRMHKFRILLLK